LPEPAYALPLAITMGDAAGIGPEVIARLFAAGPVGGFVVGDVAAMERAVALIGASLSVRGVEGPTFAAAGEIPVLATSHLPADLAYGVVDARAGGAAHDAVVAAGRLALAGRVRAVVTAPLNKAAMQAAGIHQPGHTEILADLAGTSDFGMMLANDQLRVMLVSIHVALREALDLVTRERVLRTIRLAVRGTSAFGVETPRIAVAGLNPHAGEGGLMGHEDIDIIAPAIADAQAEGIVASGPYPPDTVFMRARRGEFDCVVAQYHDQGLIPVKYLGLDDGVNITVGLPFVRTSVEHGTAFDIAGKGVADPSSLGYATRIAAVMTQR
jgi:4-hydroxythreonine-4-phosphate dehydrogenase